jgi:hypothetical protein
MKALALTLSLAAVGLAACSGDVTTSGSGGGGGGGADPGPPIVTELTPDQTPLPGQTECKVTITENLPNEGQKHESVCTRVEYATNPPSSGNHWPIWAEFRTFDAPVPREMYVHDLEHGAVVMTYRCESACPDVVAALEKTASDYGVDPTCLSIDNGADASRIVITPDPLLDRPIGLSAWRATYTATCIDPPSLLDFVQKHYGNGPEDLCVQGKDPADPETGIPACTM